MNVKDIKEEEDRHATKMAELLAELKAKVLALPDNPRIKRVAKSPNCFTMGSKDLGNNWSADTHDFKKQYQLIVNELEASETGKTYAKLQKIIADERVDARVEINLPHFSLLKTRFVKGNYTVKLHPDVVAWLKKMA